MAVEDGVAIGILLTKLQNANKGTDMSNKSAQISSLFRLYQDLRKTRTEVNVAGAVHTRHYYHMADGEEQRKRDHELAQMPSRNWQGPCSFNWADAEYQHSLLGFDVIMDTEKRFDEFWASARSVGSVIIAHEH